MLDAIRVLREKKDRLDRDLQWELSVSAVDPGQRRVVREAMASGYCFAIMVLERAAESDVDDMAKSYGEG